MPPATASQSHQRQGSDHPGKSLAKANDSLPVKKLPGIPFVKGHTLGGRPAGSQNKLTVDIKKMIVGALNAGKGGQAFLEECKDSKDASVRCAFIGLVKAILPKDIHVTTPVAIHVVTGIDPGLGEPGARDILCVEKDPPTLASPSGDAPETTTEAPNSTASA